MPNWVVHPMYFKNLMIGYNFCFFYFHLINFDVVLRINNAITNCNCDSYDRNRGTILTYKNCFGRTHSKCIVQRSGIDMVLAEISSNCRHYCEKFMPCSICERCVDMRAYDAKRRHKSLRHDSDLDWSLEQESGEDCNTILCLSCKHFGVQISFLGGKDHAGCKRDLCWVCRHWDKSDISWDIWDIRDDGCPECLREIQDGAVVCPMCERLYNQFDGILMVQCDDSDN